MPALRVFCDFDGTITEEDTLVLLLDQFAHELPDGADWRKIEDDPGIPERMKLKAEMDLVYARDSLASHLDAQHKTWIGFDDFDAILRELKQQHIL